MSSRGDDAPVHLWGFIEANPKPEKAAGQRQSQMLECC